MPRAPLLALCLAPTLALAATPLAAQAPRCAGEWPAEPRRNATEAELRCRFGAAGPGRFGLLSYVDVPVYQPDTPMPGTHVVGVPGHARPMPGESYEEWEWRVLRTAFGPQAHVVHRDLESLAPEVAERLIRLEGRLARAGIRATRRETWRSPTRQAYLFQQGRSRPGPLATATLTSWHSQVDELGRPAGRAADYHVPHAQLPRFHEIAAEVGLRSFGADSNDPWHVFLPGRQDVPEAELMLLRVLPRVPEVTLATGLPVDASLPLGGRGTLRAAAADFAASPFLRPPTPSLARRLRAGRPITVPVPIAAPPPPVEPCPVIPWPLRWLRALVRGARCGPPRSAAL